MVLRLVVVIVCAVGCRQLLGLDEARVVDAGSDATGNGGDGGVGDGATDGTASACEPVTCASVGGGCFEGTCLIDSDADSVVNCPNGMPCLVICDTLKACRQGVQCNDATECIVACIADSACELGGVDCGTADLCSVRCEGVNACKEGGGAAGGVECGTSTCDVVCDGLGACDKGVDGEDAASCTVHCCGGACAGGVGAGCAVDMICT
jgi:hypothetical protein